MLQLLELGPKTEFWQGRAELWASPGSTTSAVGWSLEQGWWEGKCRARAVSPLSAPSGHGGLCSRDPWGPPCSLWAPSTVKSGRASLLASSENSLGNESRETEPGTLSQPFLTFQIGNSLSSLPGWKAICISRGQDEAFSLYHPKSVIKSLFGNKTTHAREDGLCRLKLTAPVIPDFPGCRWRMRDGGGGDVSRANLRAPGDGWSCSGLSPGNWEALHKLQTLSNPASFQLPHSPWAGTSAWLSQPNPA